MTAKRDAVVEPLTLRRSFAYTIEPSCVGSNSPVLVAVDPWAATGSHGESGFRLRDDIPGLHGGQVLPVNQSDRPGLEHCRIPPEVDR